MGTSSLDYNRNSYYCLDGALHFTFYENKLGKEDYLGYISHLFLHYYSHHHAQYSVLIIIERNATCDLCDKLLDNKMTHNETHQQFLPA